MSALTLFAWGFAELHTRLEQDNSTINVTDSATITDNNINPLKMVIPTVYSVLLKTQTLFGTM